MMWIAIGVLAILGLLYFAYDRISWYLASYEAAKRSVIIIAEYMKTFRHQIADKPGKGKIDEMFQKIQVENAKVAYVLGGVKLLDKVSKVELPSSETKEVNENIVEDDSRNLQGV